MDGPQQAVDDVDEAQGRELRARSGARPLACRAGLIPPRLALAACIRAFVTRSTVGCELEPNQRFNHFPATPACSITWFLQGSAAWVEGGMPSGRIVFCGPKTQPATSCNPGPVEVMTMLLMPDALQALTGLDATLHVDRSSAAVDVFDPDWLAMLEAVLDVPDAAARVRLVEDFIEPRWRAARGDAWGSAHTYRAWIEALALRAAVSGFGRSVRQTERRVRSWAGLPMGRLMGLSRAERALIDAQNAHAQGRLKWADVALDAGFADQAHLCREARRVTGTSPQQLLRRIDEDECFWIYRLWR